MADDQNTDYKYKIDAYLADIEARRLRQEYAIFLHTHDSQLLRASFEFSYIAIKSLLLLNGAAAISTLTFIGNAAKDGALDKTLFVPLVAFGLGALAGAFAAGMAYLAQLLFFHRAEISTYWALKPEPTPKNAGRGYRIAAELFRVLGVASAFAGYGLFAFGLCKAAQPYM